MRITKEVMSHDYVSYTGKNSIAVRALPEYMESDKNEKEQGFEITWEDGTKSELTYWEGDCIIAIPK